MSTATPWVDPSAFSTSERENPYESDRLLSEYLLFHYGEPSEVLPFEEGPVSALGYPVRCVSECLDGSRLGGGARALDLGCAVGRSTFELARVCQTVLGIDYSHRFVGAAETIRTEGVLDYSRTDEGDLRTPLRALRPEGVDPERVRFEQGDAMGLREGLGQFEVVLMANLIDRLSAPMLCLEVLGALVARGGQLIVTSPYTWMPEYTPREHWLGGRENGGRRQSTLEGLELALGESFALEGTKNLPFLIREHVRKYQWSVAQASIWRRR